MNPDFLEEGDADGGDVQLLEGQFDPNTVIPKQSNVAATPSRSSASGKSSRTTTTKRTNPKSSKAPPTSSYSAYDAVSTPQTLVTISDSHHTAQVIPVKSGGARSQQVLNNAGASSPSTTMPDWNVTLCQLMTENFDVQTRKHAKFEELDTSALQRIQGAIHEKYGIGFKDIFVAMRKKSVADNKKANCTCSDCVFLAVEEVSDTW